MSAKFLDRFRKLPGRVALLYLFFGLFWILFSDRLLLLAGLSPKKLTELQTGKGWIFVGLSALLFYLLLRRETARLAAAEGALAESRTLLKNVIEQITDPIYAKDLEGRYLLVNPAVSRFTGISAERTLGSRDAEIFPTGATTAILAQDRRVLEREETLTLEGTHATALGEERRLLTTKGPLRDESGRLIGLFGISRDITDQKAAEEALRQSERRFRLLFQEMTSGFALHEVLYGAEGEPTDYRFLNVNPAFETLTGLKAEQVLGRTVREIFPDLPGHWIERYARVALGEGATVFEDFATPLQKYFVVRAYSPEPGKFATIFNDITQRKRAEEELRKLNQELERRVRERTADLEARNRDLEVFSYSISHDLRAPLRAVQGFSAILADHHREALDEEGRRYLDHVVTAAERMDRFIEGLLAYVRLGRRGVHSRAVPLDRILQPLAEEISERIRQSGGRLEIPEKLPVVRGDATLLQQVFANLLDNAVHYRRPEVPPRVALSWKRDGEEVVVRVEDNGIGISADQVEKIFQPFQRLQSDETYPGTGIGLAVVRKALELLGGNIGVTSSLDEGSVFSVRLPCPPGPTERNQDKVG